jgi:hypothetical protein
MRRSYKRDIGPAPPIYPFSINFNVVKDQPITGSIGRSAHAKIVDLSHLVNVRTPGWVGYAWQQNVLEWMLEKKIKWFGIDCGSGDHPTNTSIRDMRPDLARRFEKRVGMSCKELFGEYEYVHDKSGPHVTEDVFPFHSYAFQDGLIHAENVGGDIEEVLNQQRIIGAFPWRYEGREACPRRIVVLRAIDEAVEAVGDAAKAIFAGRSSFLRSARGWSCRTLTVWPNL